MNLTPLSNIMLKLRCVHFTLHWLYTFNRKLFCGKGQRVVEYCVAWPQPWQQLFEPGGLLTTAKVRWHNKHRLKLVRYKKGTAREKQISLTPSQLLLASSLTSPENPSHPVLSFLANLSVKLCDIRRRLRSWLLNLLLLGIMGRRGRSCRGIVVHSDLGVFWVTLRRQLHCSTVFILGKTDICVVQLLETTKPGTTCEITFTVILHQMKY